MEGFKDLPWPVSDVGTNLEESYSLNMSEYQRNNPTDAFFCNLLEIDPLLLEQKHEETSIQNEIEENQSRQFPDPRTGVEIPSYECNYKNVDFEKRNFFLTHYIQASNLQKCEHVACLNALRRSKTTSNLSTDEQKNQMIYESCATNRFEENTLFLEKLRQFYFEKLSKRFHDVPPSINYFVTQCWKKRLIAMHRRLANFKYRMRTAISLQSTQCTVKTNTLHQEHLGNVPEMRDNAIEYMRQSSSNLMNIYNRRKISRLLPMIKNKMKELVQEHGVDFILPISILKAIVSGKKGWSSCMSVKESAQSDTFNQKNEIIFEKPLPPIYLSGNERYKKGAKYVLQSCFNQNSLSVFNHNSQTEIKTNVDSQIQTRQIDDQINEPILNTLEYKISKNDEFIVNHSKSECSYENMSFSIIDVIGSENSDDGDETFRLLISAKQSAYKKDENGEIAFVNYSPKIEFQAEYGAETMRKDELIHEWCDLYFGPHTSTERVRFDSVSGKVIQRQMISVMDVENELEHQCGIESQHLLQRLYHTLQTFSGFPVGDYLLQSDCKKNDFVKVYERTDTAESLSIRQIFKDVSFNLNVFDKGEWQPIDDQIVTEIHEKCEMLPCSFPHVDYLKKHHVEPRNDKSQFIANKVVKKGKRLLKIQPRDDSNDVLRKLQNVQSRQKAFKTRISQSRKQKKTRQRVKKKAIEEIRTAEAREYDSTKKLLVATMDQYSTPSGQSLPNVPITRNTTIANSSIATRTRRKSKCVSSSEKPSVQNVRRSNRVNKFQ